MFIVTTESATGSKTYTIRKVGDQLVCSCHDHLYQSHGAAYVCKHLATLVIEMVQFATTATKSKAAEKILS